MRGTNSACAVALGSVLLACATPPPPEGSSSSGLALHLDARSPLSIIPARMEQVLFVRLDESRDDPILSSSIFYSNYKNDGYFYLLNPPPGRYVAVAAVTTTTPPYAPEAPPPAFDKDGKLNTDTPPGHRPWGSPAPGSFDQAIYFDEDLVRQTEVTARPGSLSFMGEFLVHTSVLRGKDPVQTHYFRLLQPGESGNVLVQIVLHNSSSFSGRVAEVQRGEAARERFSLKASEHLMSAGWGEMLKGVGEGPTP